LSEQRTGERVPAASRTPEEADSHRAFELSSNIARTDLSQGIPEVASKAEKASRLLDHRARSVPPVQSVASDTPGWARDGYNVTVAVGDAPVKIPGREAIVP
jgi:hypothetical protein